MNSIERVKLIREIFSIEPGASLLKALEQQAKSDMYYDTDPNAVYYGLGRFHLIDSWRKIVEADPEEFKLMIEEQEDDRPNSASNG